MFRYDATGVETEGGYPLLKDGWYPFKIFDAEESRSKKDHPMVIVKAEVTDPRHKGAQVWHWVTFIPKDLKGAGMAIHFLKCIGEPFEGNLEIVPFDWIGKRFMGKVTAEEYQGKKRNKLVEVSPFTAAAATATAPVGVAAAKDADDDSIPF